MAMSRKSRKQLHKEIYDRCHSGYKYSNGYDPMVEIVCDNGADVIDIYGTKYPNHDTNDYSKASARAYKKPGNEH